MNALHFNEILEFLKAQKFKIHPDDGIFEHDFEVETGNRKYVIIFYLETYTTPSGALYYDLHDGIGIYDDDTRDSVELSYAKENEIVKIIERDVLDYEC